MAKKKTGITEETNENNLLESEETTDITNSSRSNEALQDALAEINKKHGNGTICFLGDNILDYETKVFSTGILSLDLALGGGFPEGRIIEIYGSNMSGKTVLSIYAAISVQKRNDGKKVVLIDLEGTFNKDMARTNGLNVEDLIIAQPMTGEQAFDIIERLSSTGRIGLIIFDSVASAQPAAMNEKDIGSASMGVQAKMFSECIRRVLPVLNRTKTSLIFINQTREKVGVMFGNPETTTGGKALPFYASMRLEVRPVEYLSETGAMVKTKEDAIGQRVKVKVQKNKIAAPFKTCDYILRFGVGIDQDADIIATGIQLGVIKKGGAWLTWSDVKGCGEMKFLDAVKDSGNLDVLRVEIQEKMKEIFGR